MSLATKMAVYAASAAYHLVCWNEPHLERRALIVDVSLVPLAILGGVLPFSELGGLGIAKDCALGAFVLALNVLFVAVQFRHGPKYQPLDSTPRSIVCILYFVYNEVVAGLALGFDTVRWKLTPFFYLSAFLCAAGVDKHRESLREPLVFPHHRKGLWSLHEDFHFLLLVADLYSCRLGWNLAFPPHVSLG